MGLCELLFAMEEAMRTIVALGFVSLSVHSAFAQQPLDIQTVTVGPWVIGTTYKADKFENCTMTRSAGGLGITFVRTQDGLLLLLDSPKWRLERGKAYTVQLGAGPQIVEAKALAETKAVTISLADRAFNQKLSTANFLDVRGEGTKLQVPLDQSAAALERLNLCFERNSRESSESNPFVAPTKRP